VKLSLPDEGGLFRNIKAIKYFGIMGTRLTPNQDFALPV
jgi:hypothetical protein